MVERAGANGVKQDENEEKERWVGKPLSEIPDEGPLDERQRVVRGFDNIKGLFGLGWSLEDAIEMGHDWNTQSNSLLKDDEVVGIVKSKHDDFLKERDEEKRGKKEAGQGTPLEKRQKLDTFFFGRDLLCQQDEGIAWSIEGVIPHKGITMIAGVAGVGKTWLAMLIARAISWGDPFLERKTKKAGVVYFDLENPKSVLIERVTQAQARDVLFTTSWSLPIPFTLWLDFLNKMAMAGYVIILDSLVRAHGFEENSAMEMSKVMGRMRELTNLGGTIIFLHHKGKGDSIQYRGSSDILAGVDVAYVLESRDGCLVLKTIKSRVGEHVKIRMRLNITRESVTIQSREGEEEDLEKETREEEMQAVKETIRRMQEAGENPVHASILQALQGAMGKNKLYSLLKRGLGIHWKISTDPSDRRLKFFSLI